MGQCGQANEMPLFVQFMLDPFEKWDIQFVRSITPPSLNKRHNLVCTYFVTKCVKARVVSFVTEKVNVDLLFTQIFTQFGVP